jgi:hypothetical protein
MVTYNFDPERWHENEYSALEQVSNNQRFVQSPPLE